MTIPHPPAPEYPPRWIRTIGILGGLGPSAHIEFERRLLCALGTVAGDQDYPDWLLLSVASTPDRTRALLHHGPSPAPALARGLRQLAAGGADFAVIACITAHAFLPEIQPNVALPIVDLVAATLDQIVERCGPHARVGLLGTDGTLATALFQRRAAQLAPGLQWQTPLDLPTGSAVQENWVMRPIYGIKAATERDPQTGLVHPEALTLAAQQLIALGADVVLCGCTEISMALGSQQDPCIPLVDPLAVAAKVALAIAAGQLPLP